MKQRANYEVVDANGRKITMHNALYERNHSWHDFIVDGTRVAFLNPMEVRKLDDDTPEDPTPSG